MDDTGENSKEKQGNYRRKGSWIVMQYGKYGKQVSRIVNKI
jgi:hypothetical protein